MRKRQIASWKQNLEYIDILQESKDAYRDREPAMTDHSVWEIGTRYILIRWRHSGLQDVNTHLLIPVIFHYSEQIMYILLHLKII